jgi:hypothetical protein
MRPAIRLATAAIAVSGVILPGQAAEKTPVTIEDCIRMVRIQNVYQPNEPVVTFSPDGTRFAVVVWRGDLERNTNHYPLRSALYVPRGASVASAAPDPASIRTWRTTGRSERLFER